MSDTVFVITRNGRKVCTADGPETARYIVKRYPEATVAEFRLVPVDMPTLTLWQPIETAPTDNARPLYLARLDADGKLLEIDFDGSWVSESESWEIPKIYHYWGSAQGIEEPTHWAYQIGSPPVTA